MLFKFLNDVYTVDIVLILKLTKFSWVYVISLLLYACVYLLIWFPSHFIPINKVKVLRLSPEQMCSPSSLEEGTTCWSLVTHNWSYNRMESQCQNLKYFFHCFFPFGIVKHKWKKGFPVPFFFLPFCFALSFCKQKSQRQKQSHFPFAFDFKE